MDSLLLEKGERGLLVGRTGSGKTQNAKWQLRHSPVWPVAVLDTKGDDTFFSLPDEGEKMEYAESIRELSDIAGLKGKQRPDYILIRPNFREIGDPEILDQYSEFLYHAFGPLFVYYDELYHHHKGGRAGAGLIGMLTRGRSKGKTILMASQRPSWITRFALSETNKFYIHKLTDARDRKSLAEVIPNYDKLKEPQGWGFHYFSPGNTESVMSFKPVPMQPETSAGLFNTHDWI